MKTQTMAMVLIVAVTAFTGCGEAGVHAVTGADWELLTEFTGPSGDLKGDAPNAVARWEIHQADDEILVLQALDGMERVYLEAWIQEDESRVRVDYVLPVHCSMITDRQLGIIIENTCSFDESRALGVSALDFITDLQSSGQGFQAALGKADGFSDSACVTARVVVGGLAGLLTTVVIFHESIIAGTVIGLFTGAVGLTVTGAALGAAVFAVSAVGTAWAGAAETIEATAGGGMVTVTVNGTKQLESIQIDPEVVSKEDVEMLQDLIVAAVNDAGRKVDEQLGQSMSGLMGGLKIPGL